MQAVILAAGLGRRLRDPQGQPKCLQTVGGVPLVRHQLASLASVGITDVLVVVGHAQHRVRTWLGSSVRYVVNEAYRETNSLYSFLLATEELREEAIVLNCDVFFHPGLLARLLATDGDALLYDSSSGHEDEHMKVHLSEGNVVEMSKTVHESHIGGENLGILRLGERSLRDAADVARAIVTAGGQQAWLASAITQLAQDHPIACLDVAPSPWVEIDFPEDLVRARTEVLPALAPALADLIPELAELAEPMLAAGAR